MRESAGNDPSDPILEPGEHVDVEFVANDYFFIYAKVGGQTLALEPVASVDLPAGHHSVYIKEQLDESWRLAAEIVLELGHRYRVDMLNPDGVEMTVMD